jgi:hypothetical protein
MLWVTAYALLLKLSDNNCKIKLNLMPYSTRLIKIDRVVGFEPTTLAMPSVERKELAQFVPGLPLAIWRFPMRLLQQKSRTDVLARSELAMNYLLPSSSIFILITL